MKKTVLLSIMLIMSMILSACGQRGQGTYFPGSDEMKAKLEAKSYVVDIQDTELGNSKVILLSAFKGDEFIGFYWLENGSAVDDAQSELEARYSGYSRLATMKNDRKFGNLAFCGTKQAIEDSGIVIVD